MLNLVYKDVLVQKKIATFGILYAIFIYFIMVNPPFSDFRYVMASIGIAYILIAGTAAAETPVKSSIMVNSLPVTRAQVVFGKYVSSLAFTLISLLVSALAGFLINLLPLPFATIHITGDDVLTVLIASGFLASVLIPIYLLVSSQWTRIVSVFIFLMVFFAPSMFVEYIKSHEETVKFLTVFPIGQGLPAQIAGLAVILILMIISYKLTLVFYRRTDF